MEAVAANGLNFIPFENDQISKLSPIQLPASTYEASFGSDNLSVSVPNVSSSVLLDSNSPYPSTGRAIFTILLPSSQILVVNSAACQLINYSSDELCSMNLEDLISESQKHKLSILLEDFYSDSDNYSSNCGQLLDFLRKDGESVSVSLYLKKIDNRQKCLAIAEPLDQRTGLISLDQNARIYSVDEDIALIFQYDVSELIGINIHNLLPAIKLPQENEHQWNEALRQQITGKNKSGESFPVSLTISCGNQNSKIFKIMIWAYDSLSGLILLNRRLFITNFNNFLIKLLFGFSKNEIINQPIENLIPNFCKNIEKNKKIQNGISNESNLVTCNGKVEVLEQSLNSENFATHELIKSFKSSTTFSHNHLHSPIHLEKSNLDLKCESQNVNDFKTLFMGMNLSQYKDHEDSDYSCSEFHNENQEVKYSTNKQVGKLSKDEILPEEEKIQDESLNDFFVQEGRFFGFAQHRDGGYIDIKYQVKITAVSEENFYCIWLSQDVQKFTDGNHRLNTKNSSFNTTSLDCSLPKDSVCSEQCTRPSTASVISHCDENLTAGEYSQFYTNIKQIGKGAFGYVKMAFRNSDGLLVVTKFIKKQQINIRSWVFHSNLNIKIPLEISLLITLQHPNIVKVLDVFHNDSFVQLVMEKHGAGFDLFEFINRGPKCDEKLKSYIFRQIISAVHYLDSLGILHRDIKDENVIINEKFEVKLIDFGSATFMPPNETFSKFYGTVEYCSPEVLQGNNYKGPELEIWALGVTLYVLTFGENPFYDIEETIKGEFSIPSPISVQLDDLLHKMLDKNVETRITISEVVDDPWINQSVCIDNYRFEEVVRCYDEEAYPPKFVYEIHSEDIYSRRDSVADSDQLAETNNSNSSLQNTTADDLGDLDDNFQDSHKGIVAENVRDKSNISPVMFSSTPVQSRNEGPCKSASRLAEGFANSLSLSDSSRECVEGNSIPTDFRPHDSSGSADSDDSKEEVISPGYSDSRQSEFEENIKRNYFSTKEGSHSSSQETYELRNDYSFSEYSVAEDESANEYCN